MLTTELAKELIASRLREKGTLKYSWCKEYDDDAFTGKIQVICLLPTPVGSHYEPVYNNMGIDCNSLYVNRFRKNDTLVLGNRYIASEIYACCGPGDFADDDETREANRHAGEIYIAFRRLVNIGNGEVECIDDGTDLTLDELEKRVPGLLRNLVFNLG